MLRWPLGSKVLGLLALGACTAAPRPVAPIPTRPSAPSASSPLPSVPAASEGSPGEPIVTERVPEPVLSETSPEPPKVLLEPIYSALGHPRLASEMATLERDEELFQWALGGSSDPAHPANRPGYHPATRVVVDVELLSRAPKGTTKRLERTARSRGYWPLRACFEQAQRLSPKSERAAKVRLSLSASGKLLGSRLLGTPKERDYGRCVHERLRRLDFSPGFTRKLDVDISVKQWPGHAPVPPRAPDDAPRFRASPELTAAAQAQRSALSACYQAGLAQDPKLWGRLALMLALDAHGTVLAASEIELETRFPDAGVVECARQALTGARLTAAGVERLTLGIRFGQPPLPEAPPSPLVTPPAPADSGPGPAPAAPPAEAPPAEAPPAPAPPDAVH